MNKKQRRRKLIRKNRAAYPQKSLLGDEPIASEPEEQDGPDDKNQGKITVILLLVFIFATLVFFRTIGQLHEMYFTGCYDYNEKSGALNHSCPGVGVTFPFVLYCFIALICFFSAVFSLSSVVNKQMRK